MQDRCKDYFEYISEFLDKELDESLHNRIKAHLEDCPECQDCIDSLKKIINSCKDMPSADIGPEAHKRIMAKLTEKLNIE